MSFSVTLIDKLRDALYITKRCRVTVNDTPKITGKIVSGAGEGGFSYRCRYPSVIIKCVIYCNMTSLSYI